MYCLDHGRSRFIFLSSALFFFVRRDYGFVDEPFEPFPKRRLVTMASLLLGTCRRKQTVVGLLSCFRWLLFVSCSPALRKCLRFPPLCLYGQCSYVRKRTMRFCLLLCGAVVGGGFNDHGNRDGSNVLPTAELILQSRRDHAIPAPEAFAWSLRPWALIGLFLPMLEPDTSLSVGVRLLLTTGFLFCSATISVTLPYSGFAHGCLLPR